MSFTCEFESWSGQFTIVSVEASHLVCSEIVVLPIKDCSEFVVLPIKVCSDLLDEGQFKAFSTKYTGKDLSDLITDAFKVFNYLNHDRRIRTL